jgi:hypothetical protein
MAGISFDYCQAVPDVSLDNFINSSSTEVCVAATSDFAEYGPKDCGGYQTPPLSWAGFSYDVLEDDVVSYNVDMWVGVEERANGLKCLWMGIDAGEFGPFCIQSAECYAQEITYEVLVPLAEAIVDELEQQAPSGSVLKDVAVYAGLLVVALIVAAGVAVLAGGSFTIGFPATATMAVGAVVSVLVAGSI